MGFPPEEISEEVGNILKEPEEDKENVMEPELEEVDSDLEEENVVDVADPEPEEE